MSGMQHIPDPYRVLGVQRAATPLQIRSAHRSLAKRYHPDAPEADTGRFLAIQEAYSLLSDPLRRREWDARHAPGPVRAGEGTTRGRGRGAAGRWTREDTEAGTRRGARPPRRSPTGKADPSNGTNGTPRDGSAASESTGYDAPDDAPRDPHQPRRGPDRWNASGRDPSTRSYTWSAEGVPWWEDFPGPRPPGGGDAPGARTGRRDPGASSRTGPDPASDPAPGGSTAPGGSRPPGASPARGGSPTPDGEVPKRPADDGPGAGRRPASGAASTGDADVYSRSSGAAWSSAARRYFRQADSDLPSRGVFRRQGTQYVTGARARQAADTEGRAREAVVRDAHGAGAPSPGPAAPEQRQAFHHEPSSSTHHTRVPVSSPTGTVADRAWGGGATSLRVGRAPGVARRRGVRAPRLRDSGSGRPAREAPTVVRRLAELSLAWLPVAAGIGYGAPGAIGCSPIDGSCPDALPILQAGTAIVALALFVAAPRLARIGALATVAALAVAAPLLVGAVLLGLLPPAQPIVMAAMASVALAYLVGGAGATWAVIRPRTPGGTRRP